MSRTCVAPPKLISLSSPRRSAKRCLNIRSSCGEGYPEDEIPQFVVSEGVHLLVMGTMARSGIPGLVIGNTAEDVLRRAVCSVVAVKPEGFVAPVSVDGSI